MLGTESKSKIIGFIPSENYNGGVSWFPSYDVKDVYEKEEAIICDNKEEAAFILRQKYDAYLDEGFTRINVINNRNIIEVLPPENPSFNSNDPNDIMKAAKKLGFVKVKFDHLRFNSVMDVFRINGLKTSPINYNRVIYQHYIIGTNDVEYSPEKVKKIRKEAKESKRRAELQYRSGIIPHAELIDFQYCMIEVLMKDFFEEYGCRFSHHISKGGMRIHTIHTCNRLLSCIEGNKFYSKCKKSDKYRKNIRLMLTYVPYIDKLKDRQIVSRYKISEKEVEDLRLFSDNVKKAAKKLRYKIHTDRDKTLAVRKSLKRN